MKTKQSKNNIIPSHNKKQQSIENLIALVLISLIVLSLNFIGKSSNQINTKIKQHPSRHTKTRHAYFLLRSLPPTSK